MVIVHYEQVLPNRISDRVRGTEMILVRTHLYHCEYGLNILVIALILFEMVP